MNTSPGPGTSGSAIRMPIGSMTAPSKFLTTSPKARSTGCDRARAPAARTPGSRKWSAGSSTTMATASPVPTSTVATTIATLATRPIRPYASATAR